MKKSLLNYMFLLKKSNRLVDHGDLTPPYFLKAEDHVVPFLDREIFIKRIYSAAVNIPRRGSVIMAPGLATNANIFRIDPVGANVLTLDHDRSFANLLASEGFDVFLYQPGYTERFHNRYVVRHCPESIYYQRRYVSPASLTFEDMMDHEVRPVIDYVCRFTGEKEISWIGYSLGGMLIYSYLSRVQGVPIKNIITVGSPISLNQILFRIIPYFNMASKALGLEESAFLGSVSENIVPLTRLIRFLPGWIIRFNLLALILFNPFNVRASTLKIFLGNIMEPVPSSLEKCFADIINYGFTSRKNAANHLVDLRKLRKTGKEFLFFFGQNDVLASPDSVCLAHEVLTPDNVDNLIEVPSAGHLDLMIGRNSRTSVWLPALQWLKERVASQPATILHNGLLPSRGIALM